MVITELAALWFSDYLQRASSFLDSGVRTQRHMDSSRQSERIYSEKKHSQGCGLEQRESLLSNYSLSSRIRVFGHKEWVFCTAGASPFTDHEHFGMLCYTEFCIQLHASVYFI